MFETNPEHQIIIGNLTRELDSLPVGGIATYERLRKVAKCDITNGSRHLLLRARERAEKEYHCIFETVRGVGIKRLNGEEGCETGLTCMRLVRRKARRGIRRLDCIDINSLSDASLKRKLAYKAGLGAIVLLADGNKMRTVAAVIDPARPIPPETVLEMFK